MKGQTMKLPKYLSVSLLLLVAINLPADGTALDEYIARPDASYQYQVARTITEQGYTAYVLDMTSQTWRNSNEVNRTTWKHWLTIIKPDKLTGNRALLFINGGSNRPAAPKSADGTLVGIAMKTRTIVADLKTVPNQPLQFSDGRSRFEDAIIAYTFDKFAETGDPNWPLLLPMVKSAVRAMDTVQDHIKKITKGKVEVKEFVVSGASKRGWTTLLTGAVDKRVIAVMPIVIDVLNMDEQMRHHVQAYGKYSQALNDYQAKGVFDKLDTPEGKKLLKIVDPYEYRDRLTMPKFFVNATGDQFFLPDSARFYFKDLPGEKFLRYVPNTDHSLQRSDADMSLLLFYHAIVSDTPRPKFSWNIKDDGSIVVRTETKPKEVNLYQAHNPAARDFRLDKIGPAWKKAPLTRQADGTYLAKVPEPDKGWTAFFVEIVFDSGAEAPHRFTTQVHVVPDRLPFTAPSN
jgi:PhoPQ-activated pathogenicity-related protein